MQFSTELNSYYQKDAKKYSDDLKTTVGIKVWGRVLKEGLLPANETELHIGYENAWHRYYSIVRIHPTLGEIDKFENTLTRALTVVTPHVLNHKHYASS